MRIQAAFLSAMLVISSVAQAGSDTGAGPAVSPSPSPTPSSPTEPGGCPAPIPAFVPAPYPNPNPSPKTTVQLNIQTVRNLVLNNNLTILDTFDQVEYAKDAVGAKRDSLLPSVNIAGLASLSGVITFGLSQISFLLPFLLPSNWFNLFSEQHAFDAEVQAYRIIQLNTVASALSTYFMVLSDLRTMQADEAAAAAYNNIAQFKFNMCVLGGDSPDDLLHAQSLALTSMSSAKAAEEQFTTDYHALADNFFNSDDNTVLRFDQADDLADPGFENQSVDSLVSYAQTNAPEVAQSNDLIQAAQDDIWSGLFGFVNTPSIGTYANPLSGPSSAVFSSESAQGSASLGAGLYPAMEMSENNVKQIQTELAILKESIVQTVQTNYDVLSEVNAQFALDSSAESKLNDVYQTEVTKYKLGASSFAAVELALTDLTTASLARIKDQLGVEAVLTTLYRSELSGPFSDIQGCDLKSAPKQSGGFFNWLERLFGGGNDASLIQLCKPPTDDPTVSPSPSASPSPALAG